MFYDKKSSSQTNSFGRLTSFSPFFYAPIVFVGATSNLDIFRVLVELDVPMMVGREIEIISLRRNGNR